ncbi:MAG: dTMP kinase [Elusimicrobia bacterium]|nr:dTMP kinase [Elusimicrobiota bacterium]
MSKQRRKGFFLVFEGIDKCGKSTQIKLLAQRWRQKGLPVVLTREPGGTPLGENIRQLLLDARGDVSPEAELFLYEASRAHHVSRVIGPALRAGKIVLCDRFSLATLAYQAVGRGLPIKETAHLNTLAASGLVPDLTLVLDIPVKESVRRMAGTRDRMEAKTSFLQKVRAAYLCLAKTEPHIKVVNANRSLKEIHQNIFLIAENHPLLKARAPQGTNS